MKKIMMSLMLLASVGMSFGMEKSEKTIDRILDELPHMSGVGPSMSVHDDIAAKLVEDAKLLAQLKINLDKARQALRKDFDDYKIDEQECKEKIAKFNILDQQLDEELYVNKLTPLSDIKAVKAILETRRFNNSVQNDSERIVLNAFFEKVVAPDADLRLAERFNLPNVLDASREDHEMPHKKIKKN